MRRDERGIALIITMFLMATLSALAVSMMFLAQTETASSRNYRTMSQARYAAEAGVHEMANYLQYTGFVPSANIDATKTPVRCTGASCHTGTCSSYSTVALAVANGCVVLGYSSATTNNPTATFHTPASNTLAVNSTGSTASGTVTFNTAAILLSQKSLTAYGSSTPGTLQTWYIISDGTVPPSTSAIVEVSATMEQAVGQAQTFAVFATDPDCGAITIDGGGNDTTTDSYNSQNPTDMATTPPVHDVAVPGHSQGGIGTNGNLNVSGHLTIGGTLTTPRRGTGACSNSNPNAITGNGSWSYGGTVPITQPIVYPPPDPPSPTPPITSVTLSYGTSITNITACQAAVAPWTCTMSSSPVANTVVLAPPAGALTTPLSLGNLSVGSNTNLQIAGGSAAEIINVNSFSIGNNATMSLATSTNITMNIAGNSLGSANPLDLSGGGTVNPSFDPSRFQITYAGSGDLVLVGNNAIAATIYAPNANATTSGHGDFYGSVLAYKATINGGASVHYDTSLATKYKTLGNHVLTSFSWKKY